jgi:Fur family transcriptional regulator, ferric uptake regulator
MIIDRNIAIMKSTNLIEQLRKQGSRITKARGLLLDILQKNHLPLTETELRMRLAKLGASVNKTTVYRELFYLIEKNVIKSIDFGDGKKRYEINSGDHHHHLVCVSCNKVDDIQVENDVSNIEKKIIKLKQFKITNHSLEFFGVCNNCR